MSEKSNKTLRLTALKKGQSATILEIEGADSLAARLMEIGLIVDESITMIGAAPLGDPLEYQVLGFRVSLRTKEADRVLIAMPDAAST